MGREHRKLLGAGGDIEDELGGLRGGGGGSWGWAETVQEQMHVCAVNPGTEPNVGSGFTGPLLVSSRQWAHVHFHIVTAWKHDLESLLLWGLLAWEGHGRSGAAILHVPFFCAVLYPLPVHGDV